MDELKFKIALEDEGFTWEQGETVLGVLDKWDDRNDQIIELEGLLSEVKSLVSTIKESLGVTEEVMRRLAKAEEDEDLEAFAQDMGEAQANLRFVMEITERLD